LFEIQNLDGGIIVNKEAQHIVHTVAGGAKKMMENKFTDSKAKNSTHATMLLLGARELQVHRS